MMNLGIGTVAGWKILFDSKKVFGHSYMLDYILCVATDVNMGWLSQIVRRERYGYNA